MEKLIHTTHLSCSLPSEEIMNFRDTIHKLHYFLESSDDMTGWLHYPERNHDKLLAQIERIASEIRQEADVLIVVGVGGSFLGARAILDALTPYFGRQKQGIEVIYVGQNMSGAYINELLKYIVDKRVYVNVISKSGGTLEPALAFRAMRQYMIGKYGEEAKQRIIVTTDAEKGILKDIADRAGYRQFYIPSDIGGRFSVLTPVGLLPVAVADIDIRALMAGAKLAAEELAEPELENNDAYKYALMRYLLYKQGYQVEVLASFEPSLSKFHEWWKQLFGESEGKQKKGLYPSTVNFSTDLHSIGQFIQDGNPILFETFLHFKQIEPDFMVMFDLKDEDMLNYLAGKTFNEINAISKQGTVLAHAEGGVPVIQLELPKLDAFHLGYLIYFFMKACGMSALLLDVNPFDQPGVEAYKKKMLELLHQ